MAPFSMPWTTHNQNFKVTPLFNAECLRNGTRYRHSYDEILIATYALLKSVISNDLTWLSEIFNDTKHGAVCNSWASSLHHCGIEDFNRFITISRTVTGRFLRNLAKWLRPTRQWIHVTLGAIRLSSGSGLVQSRNQGFESRITFGWHFGALVCALWVLLFSTHPINNISQSSCLL